jgi:diguanylate cyclase (GGDEF)-like protein
MLLLFLDIDGISRINERFGRSAGDLALVDTANLIRRSSRASDIAARVGKDEFAVAFLEADEGSGELVVERLRENLRSLNARPDRRFKLSVSTGLVRYDPSSPCSIRELLVRAEATLAHPQRCMSQPAGSGLCPEPGTR